MMRPLVLACDAAYAMPLATTMRSIVEANRRSWPLEFHVLSDGFPEETRRRIFDSLPTGSATISWVPMDLGPFREFSTISYISKMTYARFMISDIFQDNVKRILYLDADLLVLDDLGQLWESDLDGSVVGAVLDGINSQIKGGAPGLDGVPRVRDYFNAGVLIIDLNRWREERISEKALEYLTRHPRTPYSDQDALNVACDGLWKKMDPRWNFQAYYEKKKITDLPPEQMPGIVHFVTKAKPWDASIPNLNACFYDTFRSRTCFARTTRDKMWDILQGTWSRLRGVLNRYAFLRTLWGAMKRPRRG